MSAFDYETWSTRYDQTRDISPSVLRPLLAALGEPRGRSVADIGGGTGNYTVALHEAGFQVVHCDPSPGMARRAESKGVDSLIGDGQSLPFRNASFDLAVAIKVLNHVGDRLAFVREARRVVKGAPVVLVHATKESIAGNWVTHYFPALAHETRFEPEAETIGQMNEAGFPRVNVTRIRYDDMEDGSAQALKRFPEAFLSDERIMNTSLLSRLPVDARNVALAQIRQDYLSGRLQEVINRYSEISDRYGDGTMFIAHP